MCQRRAEQALAGLGAPELGEWREWTGKAYHMRRRLTAVEEQRVGPAVDIRRTPEAARRVAALGAMLELVLELVPPHVLAEELGEQYDGS